MHIYVFVERPHVDHSTKFEKHAEKAGNEMKKAAEELKKDDESYKKEYRKVEHVVVEKVKEVTAFLSATITNTANYVRQATSSTLAASQSLSCKALTELQNPVILLNVLLGSSIVTALLTGYAKYDARYLKYKSDGTVLTTVGAATALLALDTILSVKYYPKFDKKK